MEKRYNAFLRKHISLNEGEHFCPKCDGKGKVNQKTRDFTKFNTIQLVCSECLGDGKIDWVEEVIGKKRRLYVGYSADAEL